MLETITPFADPQKCRFIASVGKSRVFVIGSDGQWNLIDSKANTVIDSGVIDPGSVRPDKFGGYVQTAGNGRFVILDQGPAAVAVYQIKNDTVQGPWLVQDPETNLRLTARLFRASRQSNLLAVESMSHDLNPVPRIIMVDLEALVERRDIANDIGNN